MTNQEKITPILAVTNKAPDDLKIGVVRRDTVLVGGMRVSDKLFSALF
jgi:hypothetical protein